jgi:hypothetical protein
MCHLPFSFCEYLSEEFVSQVFPTTYWVNEMPTLAKYQLAKW